MERDEYQCEMTRLWLLVRVIVETDLDELADAQSRAGAIAPFLDPTLYVQKADAFHQDEAITQILRHAKVELLRRLPGLQAVLDRAAAGA